MFFYIAFLQRKLFCFLSATGSTFCVRKNTIPHLQIYAAVMRTVADYRKRAQEALELAQRARVSAPHCSTLPKSGCGWRMNVKMSYAPKARKRQSSKRLKPKPPTDDCLQLLPRCHQVT